MARDGDVVLFEAVGEATTANRFLIWSCTKAVVASAVWQLVSEGRLGWTDRIADRLPDFATNGKEVVTLEQVLLHTAGFPTAPLGPARWQTSESRREAFGRWRLNWEPGTRYQYHQLAAGWVLAELINAITGRDYRQVVREAIAEPLGMSGFRLGVPEGEQGDVKQVVVVGESATDADYRAAGIEPLPPPTTSPQAASMMTTPAALEVGIPGGGAVATAADLALFYQGLLHDPKGLWSPDVRADVTGVVRNTFPDVERWGEPANRTRGLVVRGDDEPYARYRHHFGPATSPRTFGHDGAAGQIAWADPDSGLSFVFLTSGYDANRAQELARNQDLSRLAAGLAG